MLRIVRTMGAFASPALLASSVHALAPAATQASGVTARVGDGIVSASRLLPYDNAFVLTIRSADGRTAQPGIWTDQLRLRTVDGRQAFVRTQGFASFDGRVKSSVNVFDPATFAPISNILVNPDGSRERWSFRGLTVEGHLTAAGPNAQDRVQTLNLAHPAFDLNCCMRSLLPAAVRLRAGETFTLPAVEVGGDPAEVVFRVAARERVRAGSRGMVPAWRVDTDGPGGGTISFWIADTPPFLVRMTLVGIPGSRDSHGVHYDQYYDMIG